MKKIITLAFVAAAAITSINANAISAGYAKQLDREAQARLKAEHDANSNFQGERQYENNRYMIKSDKDCNITAINGFPHKGATHLDAYTTAYKSSVGATFIGFYTATGCKFFSSRIGEVSELVAQ
ncbi:TPA: hypothetical protein NPP60_004944 [Klebsiella variicola subsp. variicola]|nr:hypothetical protein [Klebsiella variicola subsp. variicola]